MGEMGEMGEMGKMVNSKKKYISKNKMTENNSETKIKIKINWEKK